jgi:hypothetical protein
MHTEKHGLPYMQQGVVIGGISNISLYR